MPQKLREHAGLVSDVTVVGVSTRVEIWDTGRWNEQSEALTSESVAEAMDELGF